MQPRSPAAIGDELFPELSPADRETAVEGLLGAVCGARSQQGAALLPVRAHMFFRNLQGLWVCSNAQCTAAPVRTIAGSCRPAALHPGTDLRLRITGC